GNLSSPAIVLSRHVGTAVLVDLAKAGRGRQAEFGVEDLQVAGDVRSVVGIDDGDGLAAAISRNRLAVGPREVDSVKSVGVTNLVGGETDRASIEVIRRGAVGGRPGHSRRTMYQARARQEAGRTSSGEQHAVLKRLDVETGLAGPRRNESLANGSL